MSYSIFSHPKIFEKIKWCIANDPGSYNIENQRCGLKLRNAIARVQSQLSIDTKYKITLGEKELVDKIISAYQQNLIQEYFRGFAVNHPFSNVDYFVITFQEFLERSKDEATFSGETMFIPKSYNESDIVYELTDLAITYNKLYYISSLKALQICGQTAKEGTLIYIWMEEAKSRIDTKTATMFRYD